MRHAARVPDWQPEGGFLMRSSARDIDDHRRRASAALPLQRAASMTRFVAVGLVVLGSLASADAAWAADSTVLPNGATLKFDKFLVENSQGKLVDPTSGEQVRHLLNAAHCTCSQADSKTETFGYHITLTGTTGLSARPVDIYVG